MSIADWFLFDTDKHSALDLFIDRTPIEGRNLSCQNQ